MTTVSINPPFPTAVIGLSAGSHLFETHVPLTDGDDVLVLEVARDGEWRLAFYVLQSRIRFVVSQGAYRVNRVTDAEGAQIVRGFNALSKERQKYIMAQVAQVTGRQKRAADRERLTVVK